MAALDGLDEHAEPIVPQWQVTAFWWAVGALWSAGILVFW